MVLSKNTSRKLEHLDICIEKDVEGPLTNFLEYVFLIHKANSEISIDDVDLRVKFLGKELNYPLVITGMTGGAPGTEKINRDLALAAEEFRIALGVGSQRAAIEDPTLRNTFSVVRDVAKDVPVIANIGAHEFVRYDLRIIEDIVDMVKADALAIHLNLPQELVQPEGGISFKGFKDKLLSVIDRLNVPIIIKEVGFGLSYEVAKELYDLGIRYFDVAGAGGTNWVKVEVYRAKSQGLNVKAMLGEHLLDWGIPTAASIIEVRNAAPDAVVIGSGGIRSAYEAVKALRLGSNLVGMARPILVALRKGVLRDYLSSFLIAMKAIFVLLGIRRLYELYEVPIIITGLLKEWLSCRGFSIVKPRVMS